MLEVIKRVKKVLLQYNLAEKSMLWIYDIFGTYFTPQTYEVC